MASHFINEDQLAIFHISRVALNPLTSAIEDVARVWNYVVVHLHGQGVVNQDVAELDELGLALVIVNSTIVPFYPSYLCAHRQTCQFRGLRGPPPCHTTKISGRLGGAPFQQNYCPLNPKWPKKEKGTKGSNKTENCNAKRQRPTPDQP